MFLQLLAASTLLSIVLAAPAGIHEKRLNDPPNVPTKIAQGPPQASGMLRGSQNLEGYRSTNPVSTKPSTEIPTSDFEVAPGQDADPDLGFYLDLEGVKNPQPLRGSNNQPTDPGPRNYAIDRENSDAFAPPGTDTGGLPNAKWPMGLSPNRHGLQNSGWARQQNIESLPSATEFAGVDMRLEPNAYRELHWHTANEWSLVLNGSVRLTSVDEAGETFTDDLQAGDVWFFPEGKPHSIQALENGVEFLLVFDEGDFSEDATFLVSELFLRNPKSVLAKDLQVDVSAFDNLPKDQLYIFPGTPAPKNISAQNVTGPGGKIPKKTTYSYHFSQQKAYEVPGGSVKIIDSLNFPTASDFAAALFTIKPGAMRELHWHTVADEWNFWISGQGRLTSYLAPASSQTFDFQAGDVGYVPVPNAHYIENTGDTDLVYLEVLASGIYDDISVAQWLGLTPKQIVKDHLGFSDDTLDRLPHIKPYILPGSTNPLETDFRTEKV